jgi:hypothetical protein
MVNKELLIKLSIIGFTIFVIAYGIYIVAQGKYKEPFEKSLFANIEIASIPPYINRDLYATSGALSKMLYGNDYMPYENMVPALDIMRANTSLSYPQYYLQYIKHNTTPLANRLD